MTIEERREAQKFDSGAINQNIILENRGKLSISGVLDVLSFDDEVVTLETELGLLNVKGEKLKIIKLSIDTSEVIIEGEIENLEYSQRDYQKGSSSFLGKLFK